MSKTVRGDLNIFGNIDFVQSNVTNEYNEKLNQKKGFYYCGMYVTGSTFDEFNKMLEEVGWMIL